MRRVRTIAALVGASAALLMGAGAPAQGALSQGALSAGSAAAIASNSYHFGTYYTLDACRYFGDSLVAGGAWRYYNCQYEWRSGEPQGYWYLYMYN